MRYSVFLLCLGALGSVLFTPSVIRYAHATGAIDIPDGGRHRHPRPTARLGGLSLFFSSLLFSLLFLPNSPLVSAWLSGGALLVVLGVSDDLSPLSPLVKLSAMTVISTIPVIFGLYPDAFLLGSLRIPLPAPLGYAFSLFFILLLINAFNLIDGADGLATLLSLIGCAALFLATGEGATLLLFGTAVGFLPYNLSLPAIKGKSRVKKTRSFLGDTGALFLGYSLAVFSLYGGDFSLFTPLYFAIPLFDLVRVFVARLFRGVPPFRADSTHLHHRLRARGYGDGAILFLCGAYAIFFAIIGLLCQALAP